MSWTENDKLNEWIERAYPNGRREEQDRIVTLITKLKSAPACFELDLDKLIAGIKGESNG